LLAAAAFQASGCAPVSLSVSVTLIPLHASTILVGLTVRCAGLAVAVAIGVAGTDGGTI